MMLKHWLLIWIKPRLVLKNVSPLKLVIQWLLYIGGSMAISLQLAMVLKWGDEIALSAILIRALILTVPISLFLGLIYSLYLYYVGKLWKGTGTVRAHRDALALACITQIWTLIIWIVLMLLYGNEIFQSESLVIQADTATTVTYNILGGLSMLMNIWGLIVLSKLLGQAHCYSGWRGLLSAISPLFFIFIWWYLFVVRIAI